MEIKAEELKATIETLNKLTEANVITPQLNNKIQPILKLVAVKILFGWEK